MPWFLVGDQFPTSPKTLATSLAARGLWVTAGAWSSAHLTDGVVRDHELASFGGTPELAAELVAAGLWRRVRHGYKFVPGVTHKIPSAQAVENERRAAAERQRRSRGGRLSRRDSQRDNGVSHSAQSNPDPPVVDVVNHPADRNGRAGSDDPLISMITTEILAVTGQRISPEWAERTRDSILSGRNPSSPAAYIRKAIRNEPDPRTRFLPLY